MRHPGAWLPGELRLESMLGIGGTAEVWRAQARDGRTLAVKWPRRDLLDTQAADAALRSEHACMSQLCHAHLARAEALLTIEDRPVLIMEYCGAGDLVSLLGAPPRHWLRPARDLGRALGALHAAGWVHRDLKPRNVLFAAAQRVVLADFAAAARIGARALLPGATRPYAPPWAGRHADPAEDGYAFAVVVHELMTGHWPSPGLPRMWAQVTRTARLRPLAEAVACLLAGSGRADRKLSACGNVLESLTDETEAG